MFSALRMVLLVGATTFLIAGCETTGGDQQAESTAKSDPLLNQVEADLRISAQRAESRGEYQRAAAIYETLLKQEPGDGAARIGYSRNLRHLGQGVQALAALEDVADQHTDNLSYLLELGKAAVAARKPNRAITAMGALLEIAPKTWEAYSITGIAQDLLGDFEAARAAYETALSLSENNMAVLNNFALSRALAGDLDGGITMLEEALQTNRGTPQVRQNLALLYGIRGDVDQAAAVARMDLQQEQIDNNVSFYRRFPESTGARVR